MLAPLAFVSTAYLIAWTIVRYREIGRICSGDYVQDDESEATPYAWKSGYILEAVVMLTCACLIIICCMPCIAAIAIGFMQSRN